MDLLLFWLATIFVAVIDYRYKTKGTQVATIITALMAVEVNILIVQPVMAALWGLIFVLKVEQFFRK